MFFLGFSFTGLAQNETSKPERIKLVPSSHSKENTKAETHGHSEQTMSKTEKIERLKAAIQSGESKIETLKSEDPIGHATEIEEKQRQVEKLREELNLLDQ